MDAAMKCYLTYFYGKTTAKGTYINAWKVSPKRYE